MVEQLTKTIDERLAYAKQKKLSLMARVVIINHWILGAIWFILSLWVGDKEQLKAIETCITKFLWADQKETARHRVDADTITHPKSKGGLEAISPLAKLLRWPLSSSYGQWRTILTLSSEFYRHRSHVT